MNDYAVMPIEFDMCREIALFFLDFYWIMLTYDMANATDGAGHAYRSGAPDVTTSFFCGRSYCNCFSFLCDVLFLLSSFFTCMCYLFFYSVRYIVYIDHLYFICSRLGHVFFYFDVFESPHI